MWELGDVPSSWQQRLLVTAQTPPLGEGCMLMQPETSDKRTSSLCKWGFIKYNGNGLLGFHATWLGPKYKTRLCVLPSVVLSSAEYFHAFQDGGGDNLEAVFAHMCMPWKVIFFLSSWGRTLFLWNSYTNCICQTICLNTKNMAPLHKRSGI